MSQRLFVSFNSSDRDKAHWIAWTLRDAGHEVAVHDWEIPAGGNAPAWMNSRLAWADRLIAVVSPDYVPARYSAIEWASALWDDADGTKGAVVPVVVRPTRDFPPLMRGLSRIDLTGCDEGEARRRLVEGVDLPEAPVKRPRFEREAATAEAGPPEDEGAPAAKPTFVVVSPQDGIPKSLQIAALVAAIISALVGLSTLLPRDTDSAPTPDEPEAAARTCINQGGIQVCGNVEGDLRAEK